MRVTFQERKLSELQLAAKDQMDSQMDTNVEPKLDVLLSKKVQPWANINSINTVNE